HDHEHLVAALRALHEQGRDDRHQHARERMAAILAPALLARSGLGSVRAQRLVVFAEQLLLVCAALLDRQPAADEVGRVSHRATRLAEWEVVEAVVTVHETLWGVALVQPRVQPRYEALAERAVLGGDAPAISLQQASQQLRHERLIERTWPVQPCACRERAIF